MLKIISKKGTLGIAVLMIISLLIISVMGCTAKEQPEQTKPEESNKEFVWPHKKLTIMVPFTPGGTTDRYARGLAPFIEEYLDVTVVVENRPGGGSAVGTLAHLKNDSADGSVIAQTLQPFLAGGTFLGEYAIEDFDYLYTDYYTIMGIWVPKDSRFKTIEDLIDEIEAKPGELVQCTMPNSWSGVGFGMLGESLNSTVKNVPYQGGAEQRMALVQGEVDFMINDTDTTATVCGDTIRLLAVYSNERLPKYPDVPTINEVLKERGIKELPELANILVWFIKGEFKEKYPDRYEYLCDMFKDISQNPAVTQQLSEQGLPLVWFDEVYTTKIIRETTKVIESYKKYWE